MGNICSFSMLLKGTKENLKTFCDWIEQKGNTWMGRGAEISYPEDDIDEGAVYITDGLFSLSVSGWCKNGLRNSLMDDAISMRKHPEIWAFNNASYKEMTFITLFEACEKLDIIMEAYSEEPGNCFQEHVLCNPKENIFINERCEWHEEWDDELGDYVTSGGYESWEFEI